MLTALVLAALSSCGEEKEKPFEGGGGSLCCDPPDTGDTSVGDDTADTGEEEPLQEECATGESGETEQFPAVVLSSAVTWTLDFDADAEAAGFTDCAYSRSFDGTQFLDMDYLCPECDVLVRGTAVMTEGLDCYSSVFGESEAERTELWGVSDEGNLARAGEDQHPLGALAEFTPPSAEGEEVSIAWESEYEMKDGGTMALSASGTMSWYVDGSILLDDPWAPRPEPYSCGWECEDPGDLVLDYALAIGSTFPNVRLRDQCDDQVDLWDFYGSYLVLDASQYDCGPCRSMAEAEPAFIDDMRERGIPVRVVTFMGNGLSDSYGTPDSEIVQAWIAEFGLTDPVLYDRGFTSALFPDFIEATSGEEYGFPAWLIVDPEMRILHGQVGFSSWDKAAAIIAEDFEGR